MFVENRRNVARERYRAILCICDRGSQTDRNYQQSDVKVPLHSIGSHQFATIVHRIQINP